MPKRPVFSLIIPVAPWRDAKILDSISHLDYPKSKFEIIIKKGENPSDNRNRGIQESKGRYIVFLDDDASLPPNYLKELEEFFNRYGEVDIVGGPQLTPKDDGFFAGLSGIALTSNFGAFRVNQRYKKGEINLDADEVSLTSANLCFKREVFERINGFDTSFYPGEDPELISRAKKYGLKIAYNPRMVVYHRRRSTLCSFFKQFFNYGLVRPMKNKLSKDTKLFFLIPMFFTGYVLFLPTLLLIHLALILPLGLYLLLSILFSVYDSFRERNPASFFLLPFIYPAIHLSYGMGMIVGYIRTIMHFWKL